MGVKPQATSRKLRAESKESTAQIILTTIKQRLDLKQNIKSLIMLAGFVGAAVAGRAALQWVPSVETVTPFAILSGFILGPIYGAIAGASGFYASNFVVWGGQGPWTAFQMAGAALAGLSAGIFGKLWKNFKFYMLSVIVGIVFYELAVDIGGSLIFIGTSGVANYFKVILPMYILTSLPFSAIHLVSTLAICVVLWKMREKLPKLGAKFVEKFKLGFSQEKFGKFDAMRADFFEGEEYSVHAEKEKLLRKFSLKRK